MTTTLEQKHVSKPLLSGDGIPVLVVILLLGLLSDLPALNMAKAADGAADKTITLDTDPHLAGWWKFDEASGKNAVDSSKQGHNGTLEGNLSFDTHSATGRQWHRAGRHVSAPQDQSRLPAVPPQGQEINTGLHVDFFAGKGVENLVNASDGETPVGGAGPDDLRNRGIVANQVIDSNHRRGDLAPTGFRALLERLRQNPGGVPVEQIRGGLAD